MGFMTLIVLVWRRRPYTYILCTMLGCSAIYVFVQPTLRYRYLVSSVPIMMTCDGAARLYACLHRAEPLAQAAAARATGPDADA